jgi:hypothetical protein
MKVIPEMRRAHYIWYLRFHHYHWFDTSAGVLLLPKGIIHAAASASALTWFIRYTYYRKIQYLNNVIINKTKILHHQAEVTLTAFGYPVLVRWFHCSQNFKLFGFPIFRFWAYLMQVIPETRRAH